jgi:hypothetical protein
MRGAGSVIYGHTDPILRAPREHKVVMEMMFRAKTKNNITKAVERHNKTVFDRMDDLHGMEFWCPTGFMDTFD